MEAFKKEDERLLGTPGEIKVTQNAKGEKIETKIGADGRAERERHWTNHGKPKFHSVPHDHIINWDFPIKGIPNFEKPHINYFDEKFPEFKKFGGNKVTNMIGANSPEENRFKTISEFKDCILRGAEISVQWNGTNFGIMRYGKDDKMNIYVWNKPETECFFDTVDELLEYKHGSEKLRDVITKITVIDRTL